SFAIPQFLVSNFHGPWLVDIVASITSILALLLLLRTWRPKQLWKMERTNENEKAAISYTRQEIGRAWVPWFVLSAFVFVWGVPWVKNMLNGFSMMKWNVPWLHNLVVRSVPVAMDGKPEAAVFMFNWLSATGSGILAAAIVSGIFMRFRPIELLRIYGETIYRVRLSLLTIAAMLSLGYVTKYCGSDATLGLALARTGSLYPFFGTLLGWLGVALTGSDTASNVLFGSLQTITAKQTGVSPVLMAAANSSGGVMGKMVDAQSIVVASTATNWYGHEGKILRYVFFHSIALAVLMGFLVFLQAYVSPFSKMVVKEKAPISQSAEPKH
ncbi:MAG: L-lactate permease, partial [Verrucomicrobiales bacterium]|nr:L-lactate permease [Verrucomicrobiales bacterium]